jgi:hypothetical protein
MIWGIPMTYNLSKPFNTNLACQNGLQNLVNLRCQTSEAACTAFEIFTKHH